MRSKTASRLAWSIGIVSITMLIGQLTLMFIDRRVAYSTDDIFVFHWTFVSVLNVAVTMAIPVVGIVLASQRPSNPIGWLFLAAGFAEGAAGFGASYAIHTLIADPGSLPAGRALAWASNWLALVLLGLSSFIFLLFPTGRPPSPGWRPVALFMGAAVALSVASGVVYATLAWSHPFHGSSSAQAFFLLVVPILASFAASLAALAARLRRSQGDERLQLRWFVTAAVLVFVMLVGTIFFSWALLDLLSDLATLFFFTAIAIAIFKYRLYDIDIVINKTVGYGVLAAFFTAVYLAVVVGIGTAIGSVHNPFLTLLAAAMIALAFNPVRDRAKKLANRIAYGKRASPYEVLSEFADRMAATHSLEDVLPRTAQMLAQGTGATRADVWLLVGSELLDEGSWPDAERLEKVRLIDPISIEIPGASRVVPVRHQGELLGAISIHKAPGDPVSPVEDKLLSDVASQAGLVLRNVHLIEDLKASRQRLVTAQDAAARRLERNIHDGAQQQLVALAVKASLARGLARKHADEADAVLAQLQADAKDALDDLRELARGIYPPLLADKGLAVALGAQAQRSPIPVAVESDGIGRYPQEVEAAVYFCVLEGLQNVAKYAEAGSATIRLAETEDSFFAFEIRDDGRGFDTSAVGYGTGLRGMADRLDVIDGTLEVRSEVGHGTIVTGRVPLSWKQGST